MNVNMDGFAWFPIMAVICLGSVTFFLVKKRDDIKAAIYNLNGVRTSATNVEDGPPVAIETPVKNV